MKIWIEQFCHRDNFLTSSSISFIFRNLSHVPLEWRPIIFDQDRMKLISLIRLMRQNI